MKVFGDSLADSGTFGIKFTVQGADSLIYPERVAASYGTTLCNFYVFTVASFAANPKAGCTNYAVGGGVINHATPGDPRGIPVQLSTHAATGSFAATDLALIDGGGNDAAALVAAYLAIRGDGGASYAALLEHLADADPGGHSPGRRRGQLRRHGRGKRSGAVGGLVQELGRGL